MCVCVHTHTCVSMCVCQCECAFIINNEWKSLKERVCVYVRDSESESVWVCVGFNAFSCVCHQCLNHRPLYIRTPTIPLCLFKFLKTCTAASQHSKFSSELISEKLPRGHWPSSPLFCIYIYIYACRYNADVSLCTCIHKPIWGGYD